jgi:hypothetical protein
MPDEDQKGSTMDYGKQGNQKVGKHEPINKEGGKGAKTTGNGRATKAELVAKLKAAAEANQKDKA